MQGDKEVLTARLSEVWSAQHQLLAAIPRIAEQASVEVRDLLGDQFALCQQQSDRLEKASELLGTPIQRADFGIMSAVMEEGMPQEAEVGSLEREMLSLVQQAKSIGIRGMGRARMLAEQLVEEDVVNLLEACLQEEYRAEEVVVRALERLGPPTSP